MSWIWHHRRMDAGEPDWNAPIPEQTVSRLDYLYAWENRCRGYAIHPYPVLLEPTFFPYDPDGTLEPAVLLRKPPRFAGQVDVETHIQLLFPVDSKVTPAVVASFLSTVSQGNDIYSFEIVADVSSITFQLTSPAIHEQRILAALRSHWPQIEFQSGEDVLFRCLAHSQANSSPINSSYTPGKWDEVVEGSFVVDFGLAELSYRQLRSFDNFSIDPLTGVIGGLGQVKDGEVAGLQILFQPASERWNQALLTIASELEQSPLVAASGSNRHNKRAYENEELRLAKAKLSHPLLAVVVRVFGVCVSKGDISDRKAAAFGLCQKVGSALGVFNNTGITGLIALANQDPGVEAESYFDSQHFNDVLSRRSRRSGMLLSLPELANLVHPPSESLNHPRLERFDPHAISLPDHLLFAEGVLLGSHSFRDQHQGLVWPDEYRNRHAYILGATRMGKSTLLLNLILQDMHEGRGLCLIDPHGDLALDVLERIPVTRADNVLYLDLSDREYPLALGLLKATDEQERRLVCSDVLSVLRRLFASSWGDRLEHILRHAILTLLSAGANNGEIYTLRDIRPLLTNKAFRKRLVADLVDPELKAFWTTEFLGYTSASFSPLYNKLGLLLSSPLVRNIVAGRESKLSFADVMQSRQILIVNLASSRIGADHAHFLGALLVSRLQIAAMQNLRYSRGDRVPFTLYVDEFQNFLVSSFEIILSEAGKAGLSLVMANQFLEQLNGQLQTAILGNVGSLVTFRVSSDSGRLLEKEFTGRFQSRDMVSLTRGQAIARIGSGVDTFRIETLPPPRPYNTRFISEIRENSRERICRPYEEVELEIAREAQRQSDELAALEREEKSSKEQENLRKRAAKVDDAERTKTESRARAEGRKPETTVGRQINNSSMEIHEVRGRNGVRLDDEDYPKQSSVSQAPTSATPTKADTSDGLDSDIDAASQILPVTSKTVPPDEANNEKPTSQEEPDCFGLLEL